MRDYLDLGTTPAEENCEQLGPNYNPEKARSECRAYKHQLERIAEKEGLTRISFKITRNPHEFGDYLEVAVVYDDNDREAMHEAFLMEGLCPLRWDEVARVEIG